MAAVGAIGIDIGGTNIKAGLVNANGVVVSSQVIPTEAALGTQQLLEKLYSAIGRLKKLSEVHEILLAGVGVGTAGQVNSRTGKVAGATGNLPEWSDALSVQDLERISGLQAAMDNDVNVIAVGEGWMGAGRNWQDFVCVTLGTGIGGCHIVNKQPYRGRDGYAGEFGHQTIVHEGLPCNCGGRGCWEQYASVTALISNLQRLEEAGLKGVCTPEQLFESARHGNGLAQQTVDRYAEMVAVGLANLIHFLNPPAIIIGGGITAQGEFLFEKIRKRTYSKLLRVYSTSESIAILPALLGNYAGVVGAARLVMKSIDGE